MSAIIFNTSSIDYQLSKSQTTHRTEKTLSTTDLRIKTNGTDDAAEIEINDNRKSAAEDLEKRIGPAYIVELSSSQDSSSSERHASSLSESESKVLDANVAAEAATLVLFPTVQQSGVAALAQSNSAPQSLVSLLKG
jgi:flagellin